MHRSKTYALTTLALTLAFFPIISSALIITPTFGAGFDADDKAIVNEAIKEWTDLFPHSKPHRLGISFTINNLLNNPPTPVNDRALAETVITNYGPKGRPTSATIVIDYDDHNWVLPPTAADTNATVQDAAQTLKHEIGHALGFTRFATNFNRHIRFMAGNRYFDLNMNQMFDTGDFDLIDDQTLGTHAVDGSGDLMERFLPGGARRHPTALHAAMLEKAFAYIPEPSTLVLLTLALAGVARRRSVVSWRQSEACC